MSMEAILKIVDQIQRGTEQNDHSKQVNSIVSGIMAHGAQVSRERMQLMNQIMSDARQQQSFEQQSKLQNERQDFQREQTYIDQEFKRMMKETEVPSHIDSFISSTNKNHKEYIDSLNQVGIGYDSTTKTLQKYTDAEKKAALNETGKIFQDTVENAKKSGVLKELAIKLGLKPKDELNPDVLNKMLDDKGNETIFRTAIANLSNRGMNREAEFLTDLSMESSSEAGRVSKGLKQNSIRALMLKKGNIVNNIYTINFDDEKNLDEAILKPWQNELSNAEGLLEKNYDQLRAYIDKNPEFAQYKNRFAINTMDDIVIKKITRLPQEKRDLAVQILKDNQDITDLYDIEDLLKKNGIQLK